MNADILISDKKFVSSLMKCVNSLAWSTLTKDEIKSDLHLAIVECARRFDPKRGNIFFYVKSAFINNLRRSIRDRMFIQESEVSLSAAYNHTYEDNDVDDLSVISYISSLPEELVTNITELVLGKKTKDDLLSKPSFRKVNVDRILGKLDGII